MESINVDRISPHSTHDILLNHVEAGDVEFTLRVTILIHRKLIVALPEEDLLYLVRSKHKSPAVDDDEADGAAAEIEPDQEQLGPAAKEQRKGLEGGVSQSSVV